MINFIRAEVKKTRNELRILNDKFIVDQSACVKLSFYSPYFFGQNLRNVVIKQKILPFN
jgi:hypothetical protein